MITGHDQQDTQAGIVPNQTGTIPTQAEINDLARDLEEADTDLTWRAALMIARLEIIAIQHNGDT